MSIEFETIADNCTPRNALFCCRSPVCLNNSPKLVPVTTNATMDSHYHEQSKVFPVRVPDLTDAGFYTSLMAQPTTKLCNDTPHQSDSNPSASPTPGGSSQSKMNEMNKSQSAQDIRTYGLKLRRVTPPKCTVSVKKNDNPMMNVVLRKVEKKLLEPPKPTKHEKSPPPKKLTSAKTNAGVAVLKPKKTRTASTNQSLIAKSKSTNDMPKKKESDLKAIAIAKPQPPPPPVNLLKTQRPPLEIHKIEGDKIIIIRRVPRNHRPANCDLNKHKSLPSLSTANQNRISTYDFPMFCENEKSIHPTTHTCVSHSKPNMSQTDFYGEQSNVPSKRGDGRTKTSYLNSMDFNRETTTCGKSAIPLSKSASLKTFSDRYANVPRNSTATNNSKPLTRFDDASFSTKMDKCKTNSSSNQNTSAGVMANSNANAMQNHSKTSAATATPATSTISSRSHIVRNRYKKNDSESSSGSDLIDLTASKTNVPISEMYNDDIDYMNKYLKSLPDYNELNRKISNEQQKCEDIYDRLLCINSSLKSNLLPKSNSYHSICTASTKPYQSISARNGGVSSGSSDTNNTAATAAKNKIIRSSSSSIVNQNLINNPDKFGLTPIESMNSSVIKACPNQQLSKTLAKVPAQSNTNHFNEMYKLQNPLPKSASSTSLHRSNSKKGLNEFWSENLAKSNQQKLGWNYSKIIANRSDATNGNANLIANQNNDRKMQMPSNKNESMAPASGYKLQKNMSLSQLDQRIRQNVSREELYNLICNNEPTQPPDIKYTNAIPDRKTNISCNNLYKPESALQKPKPNQQSQVHRPHAQPPPQPIHPSHATAGPSNPISKSFSQTSMPSILTHFTKMKSPRKNSIPTLFKPLCKSTSNTHVFNQTNRDAPQETFTPKFLMKSSSSSSIFNSPSSNLTHKNYPMYSNNIGNGNNPNQYSGYVQSFVSPALVNSQNKITKNNELLKTQNKNLFHETAPVLTPATKQNSDQFFVKQNVPQFCKATVSYTNPKSNAQMPIYGNLPSTLSNAVPSCSLNKPNNNSSLKSSVFESSNVDKVSTSKLMPQMTSNSSVHDLPLRLNQSNNVNVQVIDNANPISSDNFYNKSNPIMDNQRDNLYPKMNFTTAIVTATVSAQSTNPSDSISMKTDNTSNKCKYVDSVTKRNDQCSVQNATTHNFKMTNSYGSTGAMSNLNSTITNCNYITTQTSGQQQQQPMPPTSSSSLAYSSISNATQIQTITSQTSQQMQSQQIFTTKVTRRKRFAFVFFLAFCYSTNRIFLNCASQHQKW